MNVRCKGSWIHYEERACARLVSIPEIHRIFQVLDTVLVVIRLETLLQPKRGQQKPVLAHITNLFTRLNEFELSFRDYLSCIQRIICPLK